MVVVGEKGAEYAVDQTCGEHFIVACAAFAFEETAGETAGCRKFLFVFNLQGHKINTLSCFLGRDNRGQEHGVAHANLNRSIRLLGQLAGLDGNFPAVRQRDGFLKDIHKCLLYLFFLEYSCKDTKKLFAMQIIFYYPLFQISTSSSITPSVRAVMLRLCALRPFNGNVKRRCARMLRMFSFHSSLRPCVE